MTRTRSYRRSWTTPHFQAAPALLGIGALLLCAGSVRAQTLTLSGPNGGGSSATVSGTGTAVTGTNTTFGGGAGPGTSSYQTGFAAYGTLNLQTGGSFQSITAGQSGTVNVSGGTVGTVTDQSGVSSITSTINISGGTVTTVTDDRGRVNISGGTVQNVGADSPDPNNTGPITISGGNVQNINTPYSLGVSGGTLGSATAYFAGITGGTIQTLNISGSSPFFSGGANISGGSFQFITNTSFFGDNTINITGTNLQEIGTPTGANNDGVFQLIGLLSDGETLNAQYTQSGLNTQLQFNGVRATPTPVPEASTVASLGGMLLLGGAGLALRARKRAKA